MKLPRRLRTPQHAQPTATSCPMSPDGDHEWVEVHTEQRSDPVAATCTLCGIRA